MSAKILQLISEGIQKKDRRSEVQKLVEKWEKFGLLHGLSGYHKSNMAVMLENQAADVHKSLVKEAQATATLNEATTMAGGSVEGFASVAFPLVRRVFGNAIANKIVSVQPISQPFGLIFFLDFVYNTSRLNATADNSVYGGGVVGRDIANSGILVDDTGTIRYGERGFYGLNNGYSSATGTLTGLVPTELADPFEIDSSAMTDLERTYIGDDPDLPSGTWATVLEVDLTEDQYNVLTGDNLVAIKAGLTGSVGTLSGSTQVRRLTTVTNSAGVKKIRFVFHATASFNTLSGSAGDGTTVYIEYPRKDAWTSADGLGAIVGTTAWELENQEEIPEINLKINQISVQTETKKFKAKWTQEAEQDLNAFHGVNAQVELTSVLSDVLEMEVDNELLARVVSGAKAGIYYWSRSPGKFVDKETGGDISDTTSPPDFTGNVQEWYMTLLERISDLSSVIYRKTLKGGANFIVCNPDVAPILEMVRGFAANVVHDEETGSAGWESVGSLNRKWEVFVTPHIRRNLILVGRKGAGFLESGFVYSPYVPLQTFPILYDPESFTPRTGIMTRFAAKMVQPHYYGLVVVQDL